MWVTLKIKIDVSLSCQQNEILTRKIYHRVKVKGSHS